jgi:hypothetical protein
MGIGKIIKISVSFGAYSWKYKLTLFCFVERLRRRDVDSIGWNWLGFPEMITPELHE